MPAQNRGSSNTRKKSIFKYEKNSDKKLMKSKCLTTILVQRGHVYLSVQRKGYTEKDNFILFMTFFQ